MYAWVCAQKMEGKCIWRETEVGEAWGKGGRENCSQEIIYERRIEKKEEEEIRCPSGYVFIY